MDPLTIIGLTLISTLVGTSIGIVTGLLPGLHTNNIAAILVAFHIPISMWLMFGILGQGLEIGDAAILVACLVISAAITHTFVNFIPATFLGAPEGETALSVLPGHRMLLEGRGNVAVRLSAQGSLGALFVSILIAILIRYLMGAPIGLYSLLMPRIPWILLFIVISLVMSEVRRGPMKDWVLAVAWAMVIFVMSGVFGLLLLDGSGLNNHNWIPLASMGLVDDGWMLMPLFSGLFGVPTLLLSFLRKGAITEQDVFAIPRSSRRSRSKGVLTGTLMGSIVGWLPGVTSAEAGILAAKANLASEGSEGLAQGPRTEEFIVTVSAINTANVISNLVALYTISRTRSGATKALRDILSENLIPWTNTLSPPGQLLLIMLSVLVSGIISYFATLMIGKAFAKGFHKIPYRMMVGIVLVFLMLLVFSFSGAVGLIISLVASMLGLVPPLVGVKRVHLMGCLLLPIMMTWNGWSLS